MAGEFSDAGANYALDIVTGRNAGPGARTTYMVLLTAAPSDTTTLATMAEVSTAGYARQSCAFTSPGLVSTVPETHNTSAVTFGAFTADPPNVTHAALVSASSGTTGDFLVWWALDTAKDAANGESIQFAASAISLSVD